MGDEGRRDIWGVGTNTHLDRWDDMIQKCIYNTEVSHPRHVSLRVLQLQETSRLLIRLQL